MAEQITVEFNVDDNGSATLSNINKNLNDTNKAGQGAADGTKKVGLSMTELNSAVQLAEQAFGYLQSAYKATAGETLAYADQVRQLSTISGESTESTSRFIQVLDDYKLSAEDALTATRTLTKNGYAPNIDSLAKLSDEYLSLNSAQEKNDFILKNLGRSGLGWVEVLNKGSKAIKEQGAAVSESLVLSQKAVDVARRNEIAVDNYNDAIQGLKISIGNELLPVMTQFVEGLTAGQRAAEILAEQGLKNVHMGSEEYRNALIQAQDEIRKTNDAMLEQADATDSAAAAAEDYAAQLKAASEANQELLSIVGSMQGVYENFADKYKKINEDMSLSDDERRAKIAEVATEEETANRRIILSMLEKQLSLDGLNAQETEYLLSKGMEWGIYSEEVVSAARSAQAEVNRLSGEIAAIPTEKTVNFTITTTGTPPNLSMSNTPAPVGTQRSSSGRRSNADGGTYMIPSMWGNEGFPLGNSDSASAGELITITPKGQAGGGGVVVNIVLDSGTPDPERVAYNLKPAVERVIREMQQAGRV